MTKAKKSVKRNGFRVNEHIVYPTHGVGKIISIETEVIVGMSLELFVIRFEQDKMVLRVPVAKAESVGMRKLSEQPVISKAMEKLGGRARVKRTMWSRRAQEYESKINSGDIVAVAEVVRDLYRSDSQPEQSYSERQLYEAALDRMAREFAVTEKLTEDEAVHKIEELLAASPHRIAKAKADKAVEELELPKVSALETSEASEGESESEAGKKSQAAA